MENGQDLRKEKLDIFLKNVYFEWKILRIKDFL